MSAHRTIPVRAVAAPAAGRAAAGALLQPARPADFDVRTANIRLADGAWALTARIDYRLTEKALAGARERRDADLPRGNVDEPGAPLAARPGSGGDVSATGS